MVYVKELAPYEDAKGNRIVFAGVPQPISVKFLGENNCLTVHENARIGRLGIDFDCDNATVTIGSSRGVPAFSGSLRAGQDSQIIIGKNVSSTNGVVLSATEGTTITIGDDVMFATGNQIRADDGHPIFDVRSGQRVNVSKDITIGNHVWLAFNSVVLAGVRIGDGAVVGFGSIVTKSVPNNCIAAGAPARVVRRDIAWERPHLSLSRPFYKPDASTIKRSLFWNLTDSDEPVVFRRAPMARWGRLFARGQRFARRVGGRTYRVLRRGLGA